MRPFEQYQKFVQSELNSVTRNNFDDEHLSMAYQLGLMQSIVARLMLEDNKNYYIFKRVVEHARERQLRMKR